MNANKKKVIEIAQNLFLEVNESGEKKNTNAFIASQLQKKCKYACDQSTIYRWSKKYDWESLFEKIKMAGIEKGQEQLQEKENKLIDEKAQTIADIYKSNKQIHKLSQQTILARMTGQILKDAQGNEIKADIYTSDLIRLLQHSEETLLNLHDKRPNDKPIVEISSLPTEELLKRAEATKLLEQLKKSQ